MIHALRYELARIRTIRSTWWLTGIALVIGVGVSLLLSLLLRHDLDRGTATAADQSDFGQLVATQLAATGELPCLIAFLMAIIGVLAWGHEYRHGMIRASLTALSSRSALWTAKYLVVGLWVVLCSAVIMLLSVLIASVIVGAEVPVLNGTTWEAIGRTLIYVLVLTWLAMAFTSLTRSQTFALVMIFLWPLLIESLIFGLFHLVPALKDHVDLTRFLPFRAGTRIIDMFTHGESLFGDPLTLGGGVLVFGGVTAVLMAVGYLLFRTRDA